MSQPPPLPPQQPQQPFNHKDIFTIRRVVGVIVVLVVVRGCFWSGDQDVVNSLIGKWQKIEDDNEGTTAEFTEGGKLVLTFHAKYSSNPDTRMNLYTWHNNRFDVRPEGDGMAEGVTIEFEFTTDNEVLFAIVEEEWDADYSLKNMGGRWQRVEAATSVEDIASLDDAGRSAAIQTQITNLRKRRASLQTLIEKAAADKSELVVRLRQSGVNSSSDLKANPAVRRIAQDLVRLTREIQSLQRDAMRLDEAIGKAESLVRRIEQSQVAISSQEFASLTGELLTAAERHDGSASNSSLDPISLDALLNEALTNKPHMTPTGSSQLVGKWERKGPSGKTHSLEFTNGKSVISTFIGIDRIGTYALETSTLTTTDDEGQTSQYNLEFLSSKEVIFRTHRNSYSDFDDLVGRWSRPN